MIRYTIFVFYLLLTATTVRAQNKVQLEILDSISKQALIGATICYASNKAMKSPQYSITNLSGKERIVLYPNETYYRISMIGYIPISGKIPPKTQHFTLLMQENIVGINEVFVTGSTVPKPIKTSPVTTQVISGQDLINAGYGDLQQAMMQETPGLNIRKVAFGNDINMQGLDARHVLFLIDGERMTGDMAGNLDYERFNLHAIDRIEIIKGGSSALYGSQASGAVINLITKKTMRPLSIKVGARYGQMNEQNYSNPQKEDFLYMYEKNVDKPNVQGWVSAGFNTGSFTSQTDVWCSASDAFYLYQGENYSKTYTQEANPFLDKDTTLLSHLSQSPMGISGKEHISASQKIYFEPGESFSLEVYGTYFFLNSYDMIQDLVFTQSEDITAGTKINYTIKDWFTLNGILHTDYYDRYKRHERRNERKLVYESRIIQPKLNITSHYLKNHAIIMGVEYLSDELTSDRFVNHKMTSRALKQTEYFFQDEWAVTEKHLVSAGVRTNFSKQYSFMWMPKLSAKYSPNTVWSFRTTLSKGYRSPTIKELFFNWDHLGMFMIKGNEELRPEKNKYISFGTEYSNDKFFINTTFYGNFFTDKIEGVWRIYDMQYNFEYTNLGSQNLIGCEILSKWDITNFLTFNLSYSYVSVSKLDGLQFNPTSPHAATSSLKYNYRKKNYSLTAMLSASYTGNKQFDVQDRLYIPAEGGSREAYFRCSLPAYTLCNFSVSQTFQKKLRLILGIDNVFNYIPKTLGSGLTAFSVPATPGARGFIQIEYSLDKK